MPRPRNQTAETAPTSGGLPKATGHSRAFGDEIATRELKLPEGRSVRIALGVPRRSGAETETLEWENEAGEPP